MSNGLKNIGSPDLLVLFTSTVSHKMIRRALSDAAAQNIKIARSHSSSMAALRAILFSCEFEDEEAMRFSLRRWNRILGKKGLRLLPLRFRENRGLIYVFRPSRLSLDLQDHTAGKLLQERGYAAHNLSLCVLHLIRRIAESEEFPHVPHS